MQNIIIALLVVQAILTGVISYKYLQKDKLITTLRNNIKGLKDQLEFRNALLKRIYKERMLFTPHAKFKEVQNILKTLP